MKRTKIKHTVNKSLYNNKLSDGTISSYCNHRADVLMVVDLYFDGHVGGATLWNFIDMTLWYDDVSTTPIAVTSLSRG